MSRRQLLRATAPPTLALGLALLLVHPSGAPVGPRSPVRAAGGGSGPVVAFGADVRVTGGRLHTAVLVARGEPAGTADVVGAHGCAVPARPGVAATLDCAYAGQPVVTVVVTLSDGRHLTHTVAPVIG